MNKYQAAFRLFGKSIEKTMDNFTMDELIELKEADKVLQELVDRATPKRVIYVKLFGEHVATCPNCHKGVFEHDAFNTKIMYSGQFCSHCGQSLEWEEGEKK